MGKTAVILISLGILMMIIALLGIVQMGDPLIAAEGLYNSGDRYGHHMFRQFKVTGEKLDLETLDAYVEDYIGLYPEDLQISDVFTFSDSDYYYSIIESETGRGAMELLVNPYTGTVYPEFGPNMMWNLRYGMHGRRGMKGGMMHRPFGWDDYPLVNDISKDEAISIGLKFVQSNVGSNIEIGHEAHDFYGYYTLHVEDNNTVIGMLSVNGFTGDVWYHDWHDKVSEVISSHHE